MSKRKYGIKTKMLTYMTHHPRVEITTQDLAEAFPEYTAKQIRNALYRYSKDRITGITRVDYGVYRYDPKEILADQPNSEEEFDKTDQLNLTGTYTIVGVSSDKLLVILDDLPNYYTLMPTDWLRFTHTPM